MESLRLMWADDYGLLITYYFKFRGFQVRFQQKTSWPSGNVEAMWRHTRRRCVTLTHKNNNGLFFQLISLIQKIIEAYIVNWDKIYGLSFLILTLISPYQITTTTESNFPCWKHRWQKQNKDNLSSALRFKNVLIGLFSSVNDDTSWQNNCYFFFIKVIRQNNKLNLGFCVSTFSMELVLSFIIINPLSGLLLDQKIWQKISLMFFLGKSSSKNGWDMWTKYFKNWLIWATQISFKWTVRHLMYVTFATMVLLSIHQPNAVKY